MKQCIPEESRIEGASALERVSHRPAIAKLFNTESEYFSQQAPIPELIRWFLKPIVT
jgi:hypothetical protein